jgi:tetratricopeptide (TPR) repeat protein
VGTNTPQVGTSGFTQPEADRPFAGPADEDHPFSDRLSSLQLISDRQLREALNVPADVLLKTIISSEPPPLPKPHLSRAAVFPSLARDFDSHRSVAVIGYPECGKTVAVAEFATAYPARLFWFSASGSESNPDAWLVLFCFSLAQYVNAKSLLPHDLRGALAAIREPLLLVIDNAQHCANLDALAFLFEATSAAPKLSVLLVGTDEPAFVGAVRSRGIAVYRLPGLREQEAQSLLGMDGRGLSSDQLRALEFLRLRVDGHLGMLRLSRDAIRQITSSAHLDAFVSKMSSTLGSDLQSLQCAMIERLREGMDNNEIELCRRLSIVIRPFPRRVGERVWSVDRREDDFHKVWNGCVVGVFECQPSGRYELPELYRDGFHLEIDKTQVTTWHRAVADAFQEREGDSIDVFDIHAAVFHRVLSGEVAAALDAASMYLAFARGPHARSAQAFLLRRFEDCLGSSAFDPSIPATQRIRWHAICAQVNAEIGSEEKADASATALYELLCLASDATPDAELLGWATVLMQASRSGKPGLALTAAARQDIPVPEEFRDGAPAWREILVITAYLNSSENPLPYLRTILKGRASEPKAKLLWGKLTDYDFWRASTAAIYSREQERKGDKRNATELNVEVTALAADCRAAGEYEVACLVECLLVHMRIDLMRDFGTACDLAERTVELIGEGFDARVAAYVHDTVGDALRCSGRDDEAVSAYMRALALWPFAESPDKAETLLMLGISQAKRGRFSDAATSAGAAAQLYLKPTRHPSMAPLPLAATRCLLEAAASSIHGNDYLKAASYLIEAHDLLKDNYRQRAEWAALGQIAWSLANRLKPDPNNPQPPIPGFTLALGETMPGAGEMLNYAPTMMLARACAAVGRPHRAIRYFEMALAECEAPDVRGHIGILGHDAAIEARDLATAVKFTLLGGDWLVAVPPEMTGRKDAFLLDYLVGRTVQLASLPETAQEALATIDGALAIMVGLTGDTVASLVLESSLKAYRSAWVDGKESALEDAFLLALGQHARWVARDIAWYWCFRFSLGRPLYEKHYFLWHWRLCWLSLDIAPADTAYLNGALEQERHFWMDIPEESRSDGTNRVRSALDQMGAPSGAILESVIAELATVACKSLNATQVAQELGRTLRVTTHAMCLAKAVDALYIRLLDLVLYPGAAEFLSTLRGDIAPVLDALRSSASLAEGLAHFNDVEALAEVLQAGRPSTEAFKALCRASGRARELGANSSAQLYTWIRHFAQYSSDDFGFDKISDLLISDHVRELLQDDSLIQYTKINLAICHLVGKAFQAQRRLQRALATLSTQAQMETPIAISAVRSAQSARDAAVEELTSVVKKLELVRTEAIDANLKHQLASCCLELAGVRRLTGAAFVVHACDESAKDRWLKPAIADLREAIEAARPLDSSEAVDVALIAASSGETVARALEDHAAVSEFSAVVDEIRSLGGYDESIAARAALEVGDVLNLRSDSHDDYTFPRPDEEDKIQYFTDHMMVSTGWPEDRRRFVEDDVRKMARIGLEQDEYCQHLQPLQNLLHSRSPHTAYASRTKYTCSCTLLAYQTQIENEDIDTVINAMKRVYCDNCSSRSPRKLKPSGE